MLKVEKIAVLYRDVQALREVSLEVPEGKIVALLGPNAAGKSTTLRAISGVVKVRSGRITLDEKSIHNLPAYQIVEKRIIHVPEGRGLFSTLTVQENLELGAYTSQARRFSHESLKRVFTLFPKLEGTKAAGRGFFVRRGATDVCPCKGTDGETAASHDRRNVSGTGSHAGPGHVRYCSKDC